MRESAAAAALLYAIARNFMDKKRGGKVEMTSELKKKLRAISSWPPIRVVQSRPNSEPCFSTAQTLFFSIGTSFSSSVMEEPIKHFNYSQPDSQLLYTYSTKH